MSKMKEYCLKYLFLFGLMSQVFCADKLLIDEVRVEFLKLEDTIWEFLLQEEIVNNNYISDQEKWVPAETVIEEFRNFDKYVQQMPQDLLYGMQAVRNAPAFLLLYSDLRIIRDLYEKFRTFQTQNFTTEDKYSDDQAQRITMEDMIYNILYDEKSNANKTVYNILRRAFGHGNENLVLEVREIVAYRDSFVCKNYNQPEVQVFSNLYNLLALTDLKAYIMIQFGYLAQRVMSKGNNTLASLLARKEYKDRVYETYTTLKRYMQTSNDEVARCDPEYHVEGETYVQLTQLIQGHIQNEVDLNSDRSCTGKCSDYSYTSSYGCYDSDSSYCRNMKQCQGKIIGCRFVESHFKACISPYSSHRRYEHITYDSGMTYGSGDRCDNHQVNSWHRWFVHCSYCFCYCDAQGAKSDRYFNLRPVMADTVNNRVVTGLRIIKHNRIIHLQIQEGKLLPYGMIDSSTIRWKPVDSYKITDYVQNGQDYLVMNFGIRTLNIDEVSSTNKDDVLTGVKFHYSNGALKLQIYLQKFDFKSGKLTNRSPDVRTGQSSYRNNIDLDSRDVPTRTYGNDQIWENGRSIVFTSTDLGKDAAQTTIPFFDSQPVFSYPAVPLRGAGIYYKGKYGFGGFVAPKILTYDIYGHLQVEFPEPKERLEINSQEFDVPTN